MNAFIVRVVGNTVGFVGLAFCVLFGLNAGEWYQPFWFLGGYYWLMNAVNVTTYFQAVAMGPGSKDIKALAQNLLYGKVLSNEPIHTDVLFLLKPEYSLKELLEAIKSYLPDEEKGNYGIYTHGFSWSLLLLIFGRGTRSAMMVYEPRMYRLKTILDDAIFVMAGILLINGPQQTPWSFMTGLGYERTWVYVLICLAILMAVYEIFRKLSGPTSPERWRGFVDALLASTLLPAAEEISWSWVMPVFTYLACLQFGMSPYWAVVTGIAVTLPFYTSGVVSAENPRVLYTVLYRLAFSGMAICFGFPAVLFVRCISSAYYSFQDWLARPKV